MILCLRTLLVVEKGGRRELHFSARKVCGFLPPSARPAAVLLLYMINWGSRIVKEAGTAQRVENAPRKWWCDFLCDA